MRNIVPLTSMGCIAVVILGTIAGGIIMLGIGAMPYLEKLRKNEPTTVEFKQQKQPPGPGAKERGNLLAARANFVTTLHETNYRPRKSAPELIPGVALTQYNSPVGPLAAYVSKDRKDGKKRPAVVWAHSGHGGIGQDTWKDASQFEKADFVVYCPSFRGENNNPGQFEMFFGEVNDLLAAVDEVAKLDYVDPSQIYVVGHNAGGTLALLTAATGTQKAKGIFAIGGYPNFGEFLRTAPDGTEIDPKPPFEMKPIELELRSAAPFVGAIQAPTYYFEARVRETGRKQGEEMQMVAQQRGAVFKAFAVPRANPDTLLKPMQEVIAKKINDSIAQQAPIHFNLTQDILPLFAK